MKSFMPTLLLYTVSFYVESSIVDIDKGIALSHIRNVITTEGAISIPIVLSLPDRWGDETSRCGAKSSQELRDVLLRARKQLTDTIPLIVPKSVNPGTRTKRFIPFLAAGAALGFGIWNNVRMSDLSESVKVLQDNMHTIHENIKTIHNSQTLVLNELEKVHLFLSASYTQLQKHIDDANCARWEEIMQVINWNLWVGSIVSDFKEASTQLILGKVTPSLIPADQVQIFCKSHPEVDTIVSNLGIEAFYEIADAHLVWINPNELSIAAIVTIPVLEVDHPHSMFSFYSVPWIDMNVSHVIEGSKIVVLSDKNRIAWAPDLAACHHTPLHILCPFDMVERNRDTCLEQLLYYNDSRSCSVYVAGKDYEPEVRVLEDGILLGAYSNSDVSCSPSYTNLPPLTFPDNNLLPIWITSENCKILHVHSRSFFVPKKDVNPVKINITFNHIIADVEYDVIRSHQLEWTEIKELPKIIELRKSESHAHIIKITLWICFAGIGVLTILVTVYYKIIKRTQLLCRSKSDPLDQQIMINSLH